MSIPPSLTRLRTPTSSRGAKRWPPTRRRRLTSPSSSAGPTRSRRRPTCRRAIRSPPSSRASCATARTATTTLPASNSEQLGGGNTHEAVVRGGDTARRPSGAWTPAVHALLDHLAAAGFDAAPRALGLDDEGCEVVTYIPGDVVWPGRFELLEADGALAEVAALIRRYHDVVSTFVPPPDAVWWDLAADRAGGHEVICHNDFAPWNLVRGAGGSWTFIDWDLAAPGRRAWDLGWALLAFIPLTPDRPL